MYNAITDVSGIKVGHYTDLEAATGCTVVLCEEGAVAGVDTRGSAPGTRETDLMRPVRLVQKVHAVVLSGGSAFGLDAACGVMRYLEEKGIGFDTGVAKVPIVAEAVLFDLAIGSATVRPDAAAGYAACQAATSGPVEEGCVGAGTGATVGKLFGPAGATKCGLGTASAHIGGGVVVAAIVAVNAFGDVVDPETGTIVAGTRDPQTGAFVDTMRMLHGDLGGFTGAFSGSNTTIGVVATNARLTKEGANKVAQMAHDGFAMAIRPVHTMWDGDTIFALATGEKEADVSVVGAVAAQVMARAIVRAAQKATTLAGVPAAAALREVPSASRGG
ncbi:MAG: P1 family peptidase [Anaerolineae bacterium]|nr:P1 family peptidase [Anaerolineae bacterium]